MRCADCENWLLEHRTVYGDRSLIIKALAAEGKGHCLILKQDTTPEFGCTHFRPGDTHHTEVRKDGAPWQNFDMVACPDCRGAGCTVQGPACHRCAGTGKVRSYDDGYVGEEQTRLHPEELRNHKEPEPDPGTILKKLDEGSHGREFSGVL